MEKEHAVSPLGFEAVEETRAASSLRCGLKAARTENASAEKAPLEFFAADPQMSSDI
jgi:hypothetical protein